MATSAPCCRLSTLSPDSLDNPARIWDHAFRHQLSEAARHLLLVLTTLPDGMRLETLEQAFWVFYEFRQKRFGFPTGAGDWLDSLKELDGNFIKSRKIGQDIIVSFHDPSIRDFMEQFLANSASDVADLLRGACFYEQYTSLWSGVRSKRYRGIDQISSEFLKSLASNFYAPSAATIRVVDSQASPTCANTSPCKS